MSDHAIVAVEQHPFAYDRGAIRLVDPRGRGDLPRMAGAVRQYGLADLRQIARPQLQSGSCSPIARFPARAQFLWTVTERVEQCFLAIDPTNYTIAVSLAEAAVHWRRKGDSNRRSPVSGTTVFETARFGPSGASPSARETASSLRVTGGSNPFPPPNACQGTTYRHLIACAAGVAYWHPNRH